MWKWLEGVEGENVAPVPLGGIYLPLEHPYQDCYKEPLFLAYWNGHFVPLLTEVIVSSSGVKLSPSAKRAPTSLLSCKEVDTQH